MNVVLTKQAEPGRVRPLHWSRWRNQVLVGCGDCGQQTRLSEHEVHDDGKVSPSLVCPGCGWHVWARLEGWQGSAEGGEADASGSEGSD